MGEVIKLASKKTNAHVDRYLKYVHLSLTRMLYQMTRSSDPESKDEMLDLIMKTSDLLKEIVPNNNPQVLCLAAMMYLESDGNMTEQEFKNMEFQLYREMCRLWVDSGEIKNKREFGHIWDEARRYLKRVGGLR